MAIDCANNRREIELSPTAKQFIETEKNINVNVAVINHEDKGYNIRPQLLKRLIAKLFGSITFWREPIQHLISHSRSASTANISKQNG